MTKISVIIPTLARPTLFRAVRSFLDSGAREEDELIIVGDGVSEDAIREAAGLNSDSWRENPRFRVYANEPTRCWGAAQYDFGMMVATGDWAVFLPDDDFLNSGALDIVRKAVEKTEVPVHVFGCLMKHWGGRVLSGTRDCCAVTANQLVVPTANNRTHVLNAVVTPGPEPRWADNKSQTFDHAYISAIVDWYGKEPQYHNEVICIADQQNNGRVF